MKKKFCISLIFFFAQICSSTSHPLQHQGSQKSGRIIDRARKFDLLDLDLDFFHKSNELNNIDKDEKYVPYESKNVDTKKTDSSKNKLEYANPVKAEESHTLLFRARQFGLNDKDLGLIDEKNESSDFVEDEKYVPYQSKNVDKNKPELKRISQSSKHIGKYYNTTQHDKKNKKREMLKNESVLEDLFLDNFEDTFKNEKESFFDRTEVLDDFKDAFKNGKDDFFDGTEVLDDFKQPENKLFEYQEKENYYNYALHNLKTDLALLKNEFDSVSRFFYITVNFKRYTESNSIMNASDLKKFLQQSNFSEKYQI